MKAITGVILDIEGGNRPIKRDTSRDPGYLEKNIVGGGVLTELSGNEHTLKATVLDTNDKTQKISIPSANFLGIGDVVSTVLDDDGCEILLINHSSDRQWQFARCPYHTRKWTRAARMGINQGLLWTCLIGVVAGLAQGRSMNLNIAVGLAFCSFLWAAIWTLTTRKHSAITHAKAARRVADTAKETHQEFIDAKIRAKVETQKLAVS